MMPIISPQCIRPHNYNDDPNLVYAEIAFPEEIIRTDRRIFDIYTYSKLRKNGAGWLDIQPANDFLATLDFDEYDEIVRIFKFAKAELRNVMNSTTAMTAVSRIDEKIAKIFGKLHLSERLFDYVCRDKRIVMPDLSLVGTRPQDTEEKTFYEDDYHLINTIVIISKILFPIFGETISKLQSLPNALSSVKEVITAGEINTLLLRDFGKIINKLINYITKTINSSLPSDQMLVFNGVTETGLANDKFAKMIVKTFVNHNLYKPQGNIMRCVIVTVKRAVSTEPSGGANKNLKYKERIYDQQNGDDGRNNSHLEDSVNIASEPVETAIIVKIAVDRFITDYLAQNNIRMGVFEKAVQFYKVTSVVPTPINELIVAMFVADPIGSAYCVRYMNMDMMVRIVVLIQIYMIRTGFKELVPLLSLIPGSIKTELDNVSNAIIIDEGRGTNKLNYMLNLREMVAHLDDFSNFSFKDLMSNIIDFTVRNNHTFNVASTILELSDTGSTLNNEGILTYDQNIISELHRFMYHMLLSSVDRKLP